MRNDFGIISLIKTAGFASSFLRFAGVRAFKPIGISLTDITILDTLRELLPLFQSEIIPVSMKPEIFKERITAIHDDVAFILFRDSPFTGENMNFLAEVAATGCIDGHEFCGLPILIFDGPIPEGALSMVGLIIELGDACDMADDIDFKRLAQDICGNPDAFENVVRSVPRLEGDEGEIARLLLAAAKLLMYDAEINGMEKEVMNETMKKIGQIIARTVDFSESYCEVKQIVTFFLTTLKNLVHAKIISVRRLENAVGLEKEVLFDDNFYYISMPLYGLICREITFTSAARIKTCLSEMGYLCTEGRGRIYFTKKLVGDSTMAGKRFLWLRRQAVDDGFDLKLTEL